jgi:hypothetical protein
MQLKLRLLSLFICFHLYAILLAPNIDHYLGHASASLVEPYLSFFELTNQWSFFAPDPGPPPHYLVWDSYDSHGEKIHRGSLPWDSSGELLEDSKEAPTRFWLRERENRRIALVSFMSGYPERVEKLLVRKLCTDDPAVDSVDVWRKFYSNPGLNDVLQGRVSPGAESLSKRELVIKAFCPRKGRS